jgi:phosphoribosylformimino-5-aminoimidazole carboxamide ribotide isomerase
MSMSDTSACDLAQRLAGYRLGAIVYTDIARDGMLQGPNLDALRDMVACAPVPIIASGGITCLEDLRAIRGLGSRLQGAIVGKALYDGKMELKAALQAADSTESATC